MKYKTFFVQSSPGTYQEDSFLKGESTKESECWIDGEAFAKSCETMCNQLDSQGYEVISITEITRGSFNRIGAGWGMNHGVLITARSVE